MKIIPTTYSFNASSRTITCGNFVELERIQLITNVKTGDIIYQFNNSSKLGTLVGNTLTLVYDTTAMNNTDDLMIVIDDGYSPSTESKQDTLIEISKTLQSILTTQERIASQSPRLSRSKEIQIQMDSFGGAFTTSVINANSNFSTGVTFSRINENFQFSNMGANHLYRNIT